MYLRNIDPSALAQEPKEGRRTKSGKTSNPKSNFSALENHLNNPKKKKSKDIEKTAENFAKDPAIRSRNFKADFKGEGKGSKGLSLQIGFGNEIEGFYEQKGYMNLEPGYFKLEERMAWSPQKMFVKINKDNRSEDFINRDVSFTYNKDKRVKLMGKVGSYFIHPRRATGMMFLENVQTVFEK
jgi:hypothetical protein